MAMLPDFNSTPTRKTRSAHVRHRTWATGAAARQGPDRGARVLPGKQHPARSRSFFSQRQRRDMFVVVRGEIVPNSRGAA